MEDTAQDADCYSLKWYLMSTWLHAAQYDADKQSTLIPLY